MNRTFERTFWKWVSPCTSVYGGTRWRPDLWALEGSSTHPRLAIKSFSSNPHDTPSRPISKSMVHWKTLALGLLSLAPSSLKAAPMADVSERTSAVCYVIVKGPATTVRRAIDVLNILLPMTYTLDIS